MKNNHKIKIYLLFRKLNFNFIYATFNLINIKLIADTNILIKFSIALKVTFKFISVLDRTVTQK